MVPISVVIKTLNCTKKFIQFIPKKNIYNKKNFLETLFVSKKLKLIKISNTFILSIMKKDKSKEKHQESI